MADQVECIYCGARIPDDLPHCPKCGAVSHFQQRGERPHVRRRFLIWFWLLVLFSMVMMWWLPR